MAGLRPTSARSTQSGTRSADLVYSDTEPTPEPAEHEVKTDLAFHAAARAYARKARSADG